MRLKLNGEDKDLGGGPTMSVARLIETLELGQVRVAVELNRAIVRRASWETTEVKDGDTVEIVHFVGGG